MDMPSDITLGFSSERFTQMTICLFKDLRLSCKNLCKLLTKRTEEADSSL